MIASLYSLSKQNRPLLVVSFCQTRPKRSHNEARLLLIGPGKLLDNGVRAALSVAVGDEVIFGKYGGSEVEVDGVEYKILRESDVLAKLA
jgi:co-chaperonin GroES (HSP10)